MTRHTPANLSERLAKATPHRHATKTNGHDQVPLPLPSVSGALLTNDKGSIQACEHNAYLLLAGSPSYAGLYYDEFLTCLRLGARPWTDADDRTALRWLQATHNVPRFSLSHIRNAVMSLADSRRRDSLCEFVEKLPVWDKVPRIRTAFCDAWGAPDTELTRAASANFFVALIARALSPGAQVDTLWVFEGKQGTNKSRALRSLGGSLHCEISASIGSTDFQRELQGIWIAELSELDSLRGREASTIKKLLSAPNDRFVQKYALHAESYPRRAVAVATTNEFTYWQDSTGARRLIPVPCTTIRCDLIEQQRLQWLAEARHLHAIGATWWKFPVSIADLQEERQQVDPWEDRLSDCMGDPKFLDWHGQVTTVQLMSYWLDIPVAQQGAVSGVRLGKVMRRLGFKPARIGKNQKRGWKI